MPKAYRYGCEDCGAMFARKADVPRSCQPYTFHIRRDPAGPMGYVLSDNDPPEWAD